MAVRDQFHLPEGTYLLSHSVGPMTRQGADVLERAYLDPWKAQGGDAWQQWLGLIDDFRAELAALLGGQAACFCPQSNLSSALVKFLIAFPSVGKKRSILMHPSAFPSMGFAIGGLKDLGFSPVFLPAQSDPRDLDVWAAAVKEKPDLALITHVHSNTGVMSPVDAITNLCADNDVISMVDIAQSAGIVPMNLASWRADMVMGSSVKWLCGGPGAGFLWVRPDLLGDLEPRDVGWFSHEDPFEFDIASFRYANDALRFWGGTPSIAPFASALGSIRTINAIGVEAVWQHNRTLLGTALEALSNSVSDLINVGTNGGTLCLQIPADQMEMASQRLRDNGFYFDVRNTTVRASLHIFNTQNEALAFVDVLSL